jgi:hypothetical protein
MNADPLYCELYIYLLPFLSLPLQQISYSAYHPSYVPNPFSDLNPI